MLTYIGMEIYTIIQVIYADIFKIPAWTLAFNM